MKLLSPFLALSFLLLTQAGCAASPDSAEPVAASDEDAHAYTTRGIVRALPNSDQPGSELQIRHEALPDFRSIDSEVVGMESMTMPFPADSSLLEGVAVGDKVSFDFEVRWSGSPPLLVTRLEVLPADTMLDFEVPTEPSTER